MAGGADNAQQRAEQPERPAHATTTAVDERLGQTSALKARKNGKSQTMTTTFQILRRFTLIQWKRLISLGLTVFGAPGFTTLTKLELNTFFPKRCMKLGPRGLKAFFVGKPDLLSPTVWLAVPGRRWKIIRVSWTQWRALEDEYITDDRDKIIFPDGRQEDLEIVHGEHEARPPVDMSDATLPGATATPSGRPRGWTAESGLTYTQFRQQQEVLEDELSSDETDAADLVAPTNATNPENDHVLLTKSHARSTTCMLQSKAGRSTSRSRSRRHSPT